MFLPFCAIRNPLEKIPADNLGLLKMRKRLILFRLVATMGRGDLIPEPKELERIVFGYIDQLPGAHLVENSKCRDIWR